MVTPRAGQKQMARQPPVHAKKPRSKLLQPNHAQPHEVRFRGGRQAIHHSNRRPCSVDGVRNDLDGRRGRIPSLKISRNFRDEVDICDCGRHLIRHGKMAVLHLRLREIALLRCRGIQLEGIGEKIRNPRTVGIGGRSAHSRISQLGLVEILRLPARIRGARRRRSVGWR
jgi:hypothetical protein